MKTSQGYFILIIVLGVLTILGSIYSNFKIADKTEESIVCKNNKATEDKIKVDSKPTTENRANINADDTTDSQNLNKSYLLYQKWLNTLVIDDMKDTWKINLLNLNEYNKQIDCNNLNPDQYHYHYPYHDYYLRDICRFKNINGAKNKSDEKFFLFMLEESIDISGMEDCYNAYKKKYDNYYYEDYSRNKKKKDFKIVAYRKLLEKLLFKASHLLEVPPDKIAIVFSRYCRNNIIYYHENEIISFTEGCVSAVHRDTIIPILNQDNILIPIKDNFKVTQNSSKEFINRINFFLEEKYKRNSNYSGSLRKNRKLTRKNIS